MTQQFQTTIAQREEALAQWKQDSDSKDRLIESLREQLEAKAA